MLCASDWAWTLTDMKKSCRRPQERSQDSFWVMYVLHSCKFEHLYIYPAYMHACACMLQWKQTEPPLWQVAFGSHQNEGGAQKQAGEGGDEVSKDSCIAQFGPYLHFNKSAEVKCLNSQENLTDVDRLSWGGSIQIHVDVHLYPCQNLQ